MSSTGMPVERHSTTGVVDVQSVSKSFPNDHVGIDDVSITVGGGLFLCLLGPSGSGKTTLLRLIGGLERPDKGRVLIDGVDVTVIPPTERRTHMVFQHHALFPHLNVRDNVAFGPRIRRDREDSIKQRVAEVLNLVQLAGYEERRIRELSGGQRQRVAIARAIINRPSVLLLDEPLASLDMQLRGELQGELRRLQRSLGSPFISVTHDQDEAMALADQIAIINHGRLEQVGRPDEIYYRPASLFVASFMGRNNVLPGVICSSLGSGDYQVDLSGLSVPCRAVPGLRVGQRVALVLRHESVCIHTPTSDAATPIRLSGIVSDRVFLGTRVRYTMRLATATLIVAELRTESAENADMPAIGDTIRLSWNFRDTPVFPTAA
jgi:ABC-type Fe3+/spermidine/putrescine transport system ATPase subunit